MDNDQNMITCRHCQMMEQIRLSYIHALKMFFMIHNKYKQVRKWNSDEGLNKYFHQVDQYIYDKNRKLNWDAICSFMPINFEKNIKKDYDMLSENEIRLCCMLFFEVNTTDIIDILPYTRNSIYVVTNRIKQKAGIIDIKTSLNIYCLEPDGQFVQ